MACSIVIYTRYSTDMQSTQSCEDQERQVRLGLKKLGIDDGAAVVIHPIMCGK